MLAARRTDDRPSTGAADDAHDPGAGAGPETGWTGPSDRRTTPRSDPGGAEAGSHARPSITVTVTDRQGKVIQNAVVTATGPMEREGKTDPEGTIVPAERRRRHLPPALRQRDHAHVREGGDRRGGTSGQSEAARSRAPPPPPPPPPPKPEPAPAPAPPPPPPSGPPTSIDVTTSSKRTHRRVTLQVVADRLHRHVVGDAAAAPRPGRRAHARRCRRDALHGRRATGTEDWHHRDEPDRRDVRGCPAGRTAHHHAKGSRPVIVLSILTGPPCTGPAK